jgi:pimeloyl-ACP methyl ester carboxylesterase
MDCLTRSFDLIYVDPPGTGGLDEVNNPTFEGIVEAIEVELSQIERPLILAGHSFGGLYSVELCARNALNAVGLALLSSPITAGCYENAIMNYEKHKTPTLQQAEKDFSENPCNLTFNSMLSHYGILFFSERTVSHGSQIIFNDLTSCETSLKLSTLHLLKHSKFEKKLRSLPYSKVSIFGGQDHLLEPRHLEKEARENGLTFHLIQDAGHFITFDQPEAVASLIEKTFTDSKGRIA